ncbi:hypothetical protein BC826DRAFT_508817 [Russula brevipes]|nr:hypothetical protein BC826DRAFT_508817 [Russula brevipes]
MLDSWPALPIEIEDCDVKIWKARLDNIIAALEHPDRVCSIDLTNFSGSVLEKFTEAMLVPFPELTDLRIHGEEHDSTPVLPLPDSFLGGSAPHLQVLGIRYIPFPALPNLLLSASGLVRLSLVCLPDLELISPESMVACLSSMNRLEFLRIMFQSPFQFPQSRPDQPSRPPQTHVVFPALTTLIFEGMVEYSEGFLTHLDTPILDTFEMTFFPDPSLDAFGVPHFKQLISCANDLKPPRVAMVYHDQSFMGLELSQNDGILQTRCCRIGWQVDTIAPICSSIKQLNLFVISSYGEAVDNDMMSTDLAELFRRFTAIRTLSVSRDFLLPVATALLDLTEEGATLPNLCDIFFVDSKLTEGAMRALEDFLTERRHNRLPRIAVHRRSYLEFGSWIEM